MRQTVFVRLENPFAAGIREFEIGKRTHDVKVCWLYLACLLYYYHKQWPVL